MLNHNNIHNFVTFSLIQGFRINSATFWVFLRVFQTYTSAAHRYVSCDRDTNLFDRYCVRHSRFHMETHACPSRGCPRSAHAFLHCTILILNSIPETFSLLRPTENTWILPAVRPPTLPLYAHIDAAWRYLHLHTVLDSYSLRPPLLHNWSLCGAFFSSRSTSAHSHTRFTSLPQCSHAG